MNLPLLNWIIPTHTFVIGSVMDWGAFLSSARNFEVFQSPVNEMMVEFQNFVDLLLGFDLHQLKLGKWKPAMRSCQYDVLHANQLGASLSILLLMLPLESLIEMKVTTMCRCTKKNKFARREFTASKSRLKLTGSIVGIFPLVRREALLFPRVELKCKQQVPYGLFNTCV